MSFHPSSSMADAAARVGDTSGIGPRRGSRLRSGRTWRWIGGIAALVLALIFLPPLINANRYQRQIARSMSESLGRPVHLDNVTFHLLPMPGLTIQNLVVSEDPAFGVEPTIRANTVEATLRLSSLWRRRVEFSTVQFVEPSVNLVRDSAGRWNLSEVLLHAARVDTAPTVQRRAGPEPRFPYIEATGGRVNIKLGETKLPFALTDADFALWLPSPNQWRVRLTGSPARTDTNIQEPGVLRIEGDLRRSTSAATVPVDLRASWHDVPMGEASRFLTGDDMGWRGMLNLEATLAGTLGQAQLRTELTLGDLRRADFAPSHPLDLQITCGSGLAVETAVLSSLLCTMPDNAAQPAVLDVPSMDLTRPGQATGILTADAVPLHWGLLWAALFSPRVPTDLYPGGTLDLTLRHAPAGSSVAGAVVPARFPVRSPSRHASRRGRAVPPAPSQPVNVGPWSGQVLVHLPPPPALAPGSLPAPRSAESSAPSAPRTLSWSVVPAPVASVPGAAASGTDQPGSQSAQVASGLELVLQPTLLPLGSGEAVTVSAALTASGYTVNVAGTASAEELLIPARYLPQLGDGLSQILPYPPTGGQPARVDFSCAHPWSGTQTGGQSCTALRATTPMGHSQGIGAAIVPAPPPPALLAPRSLSPLDRNPLLGGPRQQEPGSSPQPGSPQP